MIELTGLSGSTAHFLVFRIGTFPVGLSRISTTKQREWERERVRLHHNSVASNEAPWSLPFFAFALSCFSPALLVPAVWFRLRSATPDVAEDTLSRFDSISSDMVWFCFDWISWARSVQLDCKVHNDFIYAKYNLAYYLWVSVWAVLVFFVAVHLLFSQLELSKLLKNNKQLTFIVR